MLYGFIYNNNSKYFYIRDVTGLILGITSQSGEVVVKYDYDVWGKKISITDTSEIDLGTKNPFRYKGYYYDEETNLFLVSSRYYSPELCRWISPDDIEYLDSESVNGLNLSCYCFNNPIMYVDPDGHFPWLILAALLLFTPVGGTALQVTTLTLSYVGMAVASIFDKDIRNDMKAIGWNPFN